VTLRGGARRGVATIAAGPTRQHHHDDDDDDDDCDWIKDDSNRSTEEDAQVESSSSSLEDDERDDCHHRCCDIAEASESTVVRFSTIEIREYPRALGDNPSVTSGPPLTLKWNPISTSALDVVDVHEAARGVPPPEAQSSSGGGRSALREGGVAEGRGIFEGGTRGGTRGRLEGGRGGASDRSSRDVFHRKEERANAQRRTFLLCMHAH